MTVGRSSLGEDMKLLNTIKNKTGINDTRILFLYCFIILSYLIGILQDLYFGSVFLSDIWRKTTITGSFPFMTGWGILMIWGLIKPIERKGVLLITSILVSLMFIEEISISCLKEQLVIPVIRIFGMVLWGTSYACCMIIEKWNGENK